jgi:hypothetical protein
MNIDPKAEVYINQSPYAFAANNPVFFVDINGEGVETDYKILKKGADKGKVVRVDENDGSENNATDRILKTNRNGEVQTKKVKNSDGTKSEVAKVTVDNVAKGILSEGQNFATKNETILIGGEGQATLDQVVDFLVQFSENETGMEIAGFEGVHARKTSQKLIQTHKYKNNSYDESESKVLGLNQISGSLKAKAHWHVHPSNTGKSANINKPSDRDVEARKKRNKKGAIPSFIYNKNGRLPY